MKWLYQLMTLSLILPFSCIATAVPVSEDLYAPYKYQGTPPSSLENWELARERVSKDPAWRKWLEAERSKLLRWQAKGGDRAEWVAGNMHDYFDPATQKELLWTEDTPPPRAGITGSAEQKRFGGWVYFFRMRNADYVLLAARLYTLTGDIQMRDWAREQIRLYAQQYSKWPVQTRAGSKTRLMSSSLDEANLMTTLVPAIRLLKMQITANEYAFWKSELLLPSAKNLLESYHGANNISVWQRSAVACIALLLQDDAMYREAFSGSRGLLAILKSATTADGFWNEGTFGYSEYVVLSLLPFLHEATINGRTNEVASLKAIAHNLLVMPLALRFPDGTLPNPGDNRGEPKAFKRHLFRRTAVLLPTTMGIAEWMSSRDWARLLVDWEPQQTVTRPIPLESLALSDTGFAMLRRGGWHLFLHFGQASPNHAQYEAPSYELHHDSSRISTDLGTTVYGSPLHENYFRQSAAHNVPMVDDLGQSQFSLGRLVSFSQDQGSVVAQQLSYRPETAVTRTFAITETTITDTIRIDRKASSGFIGAILHLDCRIDFPPLERTPLPKLPEKPGFGYWKDVAAFTLPRSLEFPATCGSNAISVRFQGPADGLAILGIPPTLDSRKRLAIYVRYPVPRGEITTTLLKQSFP